MTHPTFDENGYPTTETLMAIADWPRSDPGGLRDFVEAAWSLTMGIVEYRRVLPSVRHFVLITGGWSGNEQIVGALQKNAFWAAHWERSESGGRYTFRIDPGVFLAPDRTIIRLQAQNEELHARQRACMNAAEGGPVSDFMLSFPEVRKVADLVAVCASALAKLDAMAVEEP